MCEIVSFRIAQKLKEKGFREECNNFYRNQTLTTKVMIFGPMASRYTKFSFNNFEFKLKDTNERIQVNLVDAPTISQVLKWLREEKKISIEPTIHCSLKWVSGIYSFDDGLADFTQYKTEGTDDTVYIFYDTYEQAAIAGIEYVLDNLI